MANPRLFLAAFALAGSILQAGDQKPPIKAPSGWVEISTGIYKLQNPKQAREHAKTILAAGHQPWRLKPANVAAECLQAFGVEGPQDMMVFSDKLRPVSGASAFQLHQAGFTYTVYISNQSKTPIAIKLVASKR